MKKKIALIGAIEGTEDRLLEKDYLFMINTFLKFNKDYNIDIHLLQPTKHDILPSTKNELKKLGVYFHKKISDYNQSNRDYNYTNMPIACNYFSKKISDNYDYFLWLDGDVLIRSPIKLPDLKNNELMYIYNNEFYSLSKNKYVKFSSEDFLDDLKCYKDLVKKIKLNVGDFNPTMSWVIFGKSKSPVWLEWNRKTKDYINGIKKLGLKSFLFYKKNKNFENRVEELTLDIVVKENKIKQILPVGFHTYSTKDAFCIEYVEKFNIDNHTIHFDTIECLKDNTIIKKYFNTPFIKSIFLKIYGVNLYKKFFKQK